MGKRNTPTSIRLPSGMAYWLAGYVGVLNDEGDGIVVTRTDVILAALERFRVEEMMETMAGPAKRAAGVRNDANASTREPD